MTVNISKPSINIREKLAELDKPSGIAGEAVLRADSVQEIRSQIGAGRKNLLINGDFRVSQRGGYTSATSATHNIYMLDRWKNAISPASTIQDLGGYVELKATSAGTGSVRIFQTVEDMYLLEGNTLTVSCEMKSNSTNGRLQMHNGSWAATNAAHSGSGEWESLSFSISMPASLSVTSIQVGLDGVSSANVAIAVGDYCQIKNVQLELGSVATDFEHRSYGEELALCQRYCFTLGNLQAAHRISTGLAASSTTVYGMVEHPVTMRVNPTFTVVLLANVTVSNALAGTALTSLSKQGVVSSDKATGLTAVTAGGLTSATPYFIEGSGTTNAVTMIFDSEL